MNHCMKPIRIFATALIITSLLAGTHAVLAQGIEVNNPYSTKPGIARTIGEQFTGVGGRLKPKTRTDRDADYVYSFIDSNTGIEHWVDARDFDDASYLPLAEQLELSAEEQSKLQQLLQPVTPLYNAFFFTPNHVLWDDYQTPIRNQQNRNTCSIFTMTAAMEARYKRDYGLDLDLSEQYFWHVYKSTGVAHPRVYQYENQSSYWGGGNAHGVEHASNYEIPREVYAPYKNQQEMDAIRQSIPEAGALQWHGDPAQNTVTQAEVDAFEYSPLYIPYEARQNTRYGIEDYVLLDQETVRNPAMLELIIALGHEVMVNVNLKWRSNPDTGIMEYDPEASGGAHVFLLVGYDRTQEFFYVKNSWGEDDFRKVHYDLMINASNGGSVITAVTDPNTARLNGRFIGTWNMDHDGWKGDLVIRRVPKAGEPATRLGHYHSSDGTWHAVDGFAIDAGRGIQFTISNQQFSEPGAMSGQVYYADKYSWEIHHAAGYTTWNGTPYGVFLTRLYEPAPYSGNFNMNEWLGEWDMNHDGWEGTLTVSGFMPRFNWFGIIYRWDLIGFYQDGDGNTKAVSGHITPSRPHVLHAQISFSPDNEQPFTLHYHTWDNDLFSGYTYWSGKRFGAHGIKR